MRLVTWAMSFDKQPERWKGLINTAAKFDQTVELMGHNLEYTYLRQKLQVLRDYLEGVEDNELVICVDGFDVLVNRPLEYLQDFYDSMGVDILMSAEKAYTYQYHQYKDKFDDHYKGHEYRYVNSGTYMGECRHLKEMLDEAMNYDTQDDTKIDQGLIGIYAHQHMHTRKIDLDVDAYIFWVTTDDWFYLKHQAERGSFIAGTNYIPYFIHVVCNQNGIGKEAYDAAYKRIMNYA